MVVPDEDPVQEMLEASELTLRERSTDRMRFAKSVCTSLTELTLVTRASEVVTQIFCVTISVKN